MAPCRLIGRSAPIARLEALFPAAEGVKCRCVSPARICGRGASLPGRPQRQESYLAHSTSERPRVNPSCALSARVLMWARLSHQELVHALARLRHSCPAASVRGSCAWVPDGREVWPDLRRTKRHMYDSCGAAGPGAACHHAEARVVAEVLANPQADHEDAASLGPRLAPCPRPARSPARPTPAVSRDGCSPARTRAAPPPPSY